MRTHKNNIKLLTMSLISIALFSFAPNASAAEPVQTKKITSSDALSLLKMGAELKLLSEEALRQSVGLEPASLEKVNAMRSYSGLAPLKSMSEYKPKAVTASTALNLMKQSDMLTKLAKESALKESVGLVPNGYTLAQAQALPFSLARVNILATLDRKPTFSSMKQYADSLPEGSPDKINALRLAEGLPALPESPANQITAEEKKLNDDFEKATRGDLGEIDSKTSKAQPSSKVASEPAVATPAKPVARRKFPVIPVVKSINKNQSGSAR